jgi:protein-tyrosine-phosphatase/DNA-binding transcriptional ArsR family regulator
VGPPLFLQLAAHPIRWQLLGELTRSDRAVRELTALVGEPQSLVSYHLGHLRKGALVRRRRSSADGRDAYWSIDLARCRELLQDAGTALHPGLRFAADTQPPTATAPAPTERPRVLFLCTGNGTRSQIAEALLESASGGTVEAVSAGSHPKPVHPNAVRVLGERGIDISTRASKHVDGFTDQRFDAVITLCDRVREVCPDFPGPPEAVHWSIPDPGLEGDTDEATYPAFERTADELATRLQFFLAGLDRPQQEEQTHG